MFPVTKFEKYWFGKCVFYLHHNSQSLVYGTIIIFVHWTQLLKYWYSDHGLNNDLLPGFWIANKGQFAIQIFPLFRCLFAIQIPTVTLFWHSMFNFLSHSDFVPPFKFYFHSSFLQMFSFFLFLAVLLLDSLSVCRYVFMLSVYSVQRRETSSVCLFLLPVHLFKNYLLSSFFSVKKNQETVPQVLKQVVNLSCSLIKYVKFFKLRLESQI